MGAIDNATKRSVPLVNFYLGPTFRGFYHDVIEAHLRDEYERRNKELKRGIAGGDFGFRYHGEGILEGLSMDPDPRRQAVEAAIYRLNKRLFPNDSS